MKWIFSIVLCALMGTGCASINSGTVTDAQFQVIVSQDAAQAQQAATVATTVALDSISNATSRNEAATLALNIATALKASASAPNFDFTSIDTLVSQILASSSISQKQLVSALINGVLLEAQLLLDANSSLSADRSVILGKALVVAVSQGVINQTQVPTQKVDLVKAVKRG